MKDDFLYLKRLYKEWQSASHDELKSHKIAMVSQYLENNRNLIEQLVVEYDSDLTRAILDDIKYRPRHFQTSMAEVFKPIRRKVIVSSLPEELNSLIGLDNSEKNILRLIDQYDLTNYDLHIKSSSHDVEEFIHDCNMIILEIENPNSN